MLVLKITGPVILFATSLVKKIPLAFSGLSAGAFWRRNVRRLASLVGTRTYTLYSIRTVYNHRVKMEKEEKLNVVVFIGNLVYCS